MVISNVTSFYKGKEHAIEDFKRCWRLLYSLSPHSLMTMAHCQSNYPNVCIQGVTSFQGVMTQDGHISADHVMGAWAIYDDVVTLLRCLANCHDHRHNRFKVYLVINAANDVLQSYFDGVLSFMQKSRFFCVRTRNSEGLVVAR